MTTITIERASLEKIIEKFAACGCEVCTRQSIEALKAALAAPATAPAWHDAPTVPGVWVNRVSMRAMEIDASVLKAWGKADVRWYGPIPPDGDKP